ncbi:unnamed protein product [Aspergillus oryzae]|nr:unnamed protein product [Aspergillus oryzae]
MFIPPLRRLGPMSDYERWLEDQGREYRLTDVVQYHPPILGVNGEVVFPGDTLDCSFDRPASRHLPSDRSHGYFMAQHDMPKNRSMYHISRAHLQGACQVVLLVFVVSVITKVTKTLRARNGFSQARDCECPFLLKVWSAIRSYRVCFVVENSKDWDVALR